MRLHHLKVLLHNSQIAKRSSQTQTQICVCFFIACNWFSSVCVSCVRWSSFCVCEVRFAICELCRAPLYVSYSLNCLKWNLTAKSKNWTSWKKVAHFLIFKSNISFFRVSHSKKFREYLLFFHRLIPETKYNSKINNFVKV